MKIKTTFRLNNLIYYLLTNRDYYNDKFEKFTSSNKKCIVKINMGDVYIEFDKQYDDFEIEKELFTLDIDIDIKKHVFNILVFYYRNYLSNELIREILLNVTIDDVLSNFDKPLESELMIIYQNKVIYDNGKVIDHE
ncbi:hypothetical protein phiP68_06 [Staphylococcus phage P68]|uniref:Uncharacterized protein n=1 Tax=Staphylococcus phage 44AHJD TaxID=204086 RepID=Q859L8_BP44A|nr:hypothetical protein ST44AHJD_06 [Staphylococcus phage phi44AHJD]NP_817322.1 hypothetical protein phiP68_06 [Staphylococcus phage P68]AAO83859.1 hypothetical protein [Staphylococcus phage phi44AHJD]AAO83880.1 unknown [Staphylococcus phage P68]WOZ17239.1 hypothetical protein [Staphylococcus phage vB_SauP-V4SA02]